MYLNIATNEKANKFLRWSLIFFFVGLFVYQTAVALGSKRLTTNKYGLVGMKYPFVP